MVRVARLVAVLFALVLLLVTVIHGAGDSLITKAVKSRDLPAVRKLIEAHSDVNEPSGDASTPLLWAVHNSDVEMAKVLIAAGAKPDVANHYGVTPLMEASRTGDAAMMDVLIKAGADPKRTHTEGETTLMAAARSGSITAVRLLLDHGVDVNATDSYQHESALMWASEEDHLDVVDTLLKAGANPNLQAHVTSLTERKNADYPTGGFSALMWAARNGYEDVVRRLAEGGADLNLKNGDHASAAMIAIYNDRFDLAKVLWDLGADVNDGSLYTAVEMRDSTTDQFAFDGSRLRPSHPNKLTALDLVKMLLDRGADPYKQFTGQFHSTSMPNSDRFDNSPFFRAAVESDVEVLKVMVAHGIDVDKTVPLPPPAPKDATADQAGGGRGGRGNPNAGRTAAMVTMTGGRGPQMTGGPGYIRSGTVPYREPGSRKPEEAFALLLKAGANPNAKAPDGNTMLHMAAQAGNLDMIRALADAGVKFDATNKDGLTALDVAEGKQPAGKNSAGERAAAPPAGGGGARGRGGRGAKSQQNVAKLLRQLMGLPPAPPSPETPAPAAERPGVQQ